MFYRTTLCLTLLAALTLAASACAKQDRRLVRHPQRNTSARTFYVSPAGHDGSRGTSPAHAWRTVARVGRAALRPGDRVLFRGGASFEGGPLEVTRSGSPGRWITFGAYGGGSPTVSGGVYLYSAAWVRLEGLRIAGGSQGIESSATGPGVQHLVITGNLIASVGIGINSPNESDTDWSITHNTVVHTGDSGLILQGSHFSVARNQIFDTGTDSQIKYAKHGIYAKGPHLSIVGNVISGFSVEGISTRYSDALIVGNVIRNGQGGIGYYRDSLSVGTTRIVDNRISHVSYGIYVSPSDAAGRTEERFVISGNSITASGPKLAVP